MSAADADADKRLAVNLLVSSSTSGDESRWEEIQLNTIEPIPLNNKFFNGKILFLHRSGDDDDAPYAEHFRGRQRRFEWRVQGKFTSEAPENSGLHFGVEVELVESLSWTLHMSAGAMLRVLEALSSARGHGFDYALDWIRDSKGNVIVKPHLAFPLHAADTLVATPPGETPPRLTGEFADTPLSQRTNTRPNTTDVFTFVYYSKYVDFDRWEIVNMPFGLSSHFETFIGDIPLRLVVYRVPDGGPHTKQNQETLIEMELARVPVGAVVETIDDSLADADVTLEIQSNGKVVPSCPACKAPFEWSDYAEGGYQDGWHCDNFDKCRRDGPPGTYRWICIKCHHDLCEKCETAEAPTDAELRPAHQTSTLAPLFKSKNVQAKRPGCCEGPLVALRRFCPC